MVAFFTFPCLDPSTACSHGGAENRARMSAVTCGPLETHGNAAACVHYLNKGNVYAATAFLHIDLLNRQVFSSIIHIFCGHLQYFMQ